MASLTVTVNANNSITAEITGDNIGNFGDQRSISIFKNAESGSRAVLIDSASSPGGVSPPELTLTTDPLEPGFYWVTTQTIDDSDPSEGPVLITSSDIDPSADLVQYFEAELGYGNFGSQSPSDAGADELRDSQLGETRFPIVSDYYNAEDASAFGAAIPQVSATNDNSGSDLVVTLAARINTGGDESVAAIITEFGNQNGGVSFFHNFNQLVAASWSANNDLNTSFAAGPFGSIGEDVLITAQYFRDGGVVKCTVRINGVVVAGPIVNQNGSGSSANVQTNVDQHSVGRVHKGTRVWTNSESSFDNIGFSGDINGWGRVYAIAVYQVDPGGAASVDIGQTDAATGYQSAIAEVERFVAEQTGLSGLLPSATAGRTRPLRRLLR